MSAATTASTNHVLSVTVSVSELERRHRRLATTSVSGASACCTVRVTGPSSSSCWRHRSAAPSSGAVPGAGRPGQQRPVAHSTPR